MKNENKKPMLFCNGKEKCLLCEKTEKLKNYIEKQEKKIKKSQRKQFTWFVLGFILFYLILTTAFIPLQNPIKEATAKTTMSLLQLNGYSVQEIGFVQGELEESYSFLVNETKMNIIWLCTGIMEIIILCGAIIVSFGIKWKKKFEGIILAIIAGLIFNQLRILITINLMLTQEIEIIEFSHDFLFRIMLFLYITIFYVIWFYWANKK